MRSISYASVLTQVYSLLNLVAADVTAGDKTKINAFIQRRAREAYQKMWWAETMLAEERYFRPFYAAATAYAAPTATTASEVYFPSSRGYYQALTTTTGNAPATLSGGSWTTNLAYWAPVAESYAGPDWAASTVYALGDTVRAPDDARFYRCHTAHTAGGSFDATKFGVLTEWLASIALDQPGKTAIGLVRGAYLDNPVRASAPRRVRHQLGAGGVHLLENGVTSVFVWFQTKPPILTGADYSAATAYAVGTVIYFTDGDYYLCQTLTTAGESPATHAAKWVKQEIPEALRDAIAHACYSDFLRPAGKDEAVPMEDSAGGQFLQDEIYKLVAMQRQAGKWAQG